MITIERNGVQYARNSSLLKLFIKEPNTQHTKTNHNVNFKAKKFKAVQIETKEWKRLMFFLK